ncbi:MAG: type II toxin-antitoxin system VapC family toxin [Leptolyngbyaceae bacterium]|nr:type II toxin-antitoxin system VapC family toxin [Leptolyngbyaceae bacterium]
MRKLVLDAGPLIGLFYAKDTYHHDCIRGFEELTQAQPILLIPLPIVFEVYKWLLQRTSPTVAQNALATMINSLHVLPLTTEQFDTLQEMIFQLPQWRGSLEDATVTLIALQYKCPIWTYNFRDFSLFSAIEFWNPTTTK